MVIRVILALIFALTGVFFITSNACIFLMIIDKNRSPDSYTPSVTPFFGGFFAAIAILIAFGLDAWAFCLIPLLLDWGCLPMLIRALISFMK